jgi:hypothetical protein
MTDVVPGFIVEPLVLLPDPKATLAGQLRRDGVSPAEIMAIYVRVFGRAQAAEMLAWDDGKRGGWIPFIHP